MSSRRMSLLLLICLISSGRAWSPASPLSSRQVARDGLRPLTRGLMSLRYVYGGPLDGTCLRSGSSLDEGEFKAKIFEPNPNPSVLLLEDTSRALKRTSEFSWWIQVILTSVSSVLLLFCRNAAGNRPSAALGAAASVSNYRMPSFALSGLGVLVSGLSILWTWANGKRVSNRLLRKATRLTVAAHILRRAVRVGVTLNLIGLLLNLAAAEQIVGVLALKVLTTGTTAPVANPLMTTSWDIGLQPIDVLIVQANTNLLVSHFCSLAILLYFSNWIGKLQQKSEKEEAE